jgi:nucleolysin TIA-1/TIAR
MYGMPPQPNSYGQYGFGGYTGFPSQAGGASPGTGHAQAGSPGGGLGLTAGQQTAGDPTVAGQGAQQQWTGADPSYYNNYWSGEKFLLSFKGFFRPRSGAGYYAQPGQPGAEGQGTA